MTSYNAIAEALDKKDLKEAITAIRNFIQERKKVPKSSFKYRTWEGWEFALDKPEPKSLIFKMMDLDQTQLGITLKSLYGTRATNLIIYPEIVPAINEQIKLIKAYIKIKSGE